MKINTFLLSAVASSALILGSGMTLAQQPQPSPAQQPQAQQPTQQPQAQQQPAPQQQTPQQQAQAQQPQVAQNCLNELNALNQRMEQDGFWLAGWGTRWGTPAQPEMTGRAPDRSPAAPGAAAPTTAPGATVGPWGDQRFGIQSPRYQVRVLHNATLVLAHRGDEQGCQQVLAQLQTVYGDYATRLKEAGVEPGQVTTWRQERITAAQPVDQLGLGALNIDNITGTEVRNAADERLGTIDDVAVDPQSGEISYVIISRGGLFGIGADDVPVPWRALRATTDLNLFVLAVSQDQFEQAPELADAGWFQDPKMYAEDRKRVDDFWREQTAG